MKKVYSDHQKEVLLLYRTCLYLSKKIGFVPGDTRKNTYIKKNYEKLSLTNRKNIIINLKKKDLGAFVAWNIRKIYKDNKNLKNKKNINDNLDYGYYFIRNSPIFLFPYCKEYLIYLWCYD